MKIILEKNQVMILVMFPTKKTKNIPDYVSSASFIKSAKIMLGFPNYAKTLASTIDKGLLPRGRDTMIKVQ